MATIKPVMNSPIEIRLLGSGGGRFATITQKRRTAGIRIFNEALNLHLDPGLGALVYSVKEDLNPQKLNAVFVSRCHPDHYTDAEVLVEAMTKGGTKRNVGFWWLQEVFCMVMKWGLTVLFPSISADV